MKKITTLAALAILLTACTKDKTKTVTKIDPVTGDTIKVEVPVGDSAVVGTSQDTASPQQVYAFTENNGVYTQQFRLQKGETYPLVTFQRNIQTMTGPDGKSVSATSQSTDDMTFTVNDFKDGVYDLSVNLIGKTNSQTANGKTVSIDTKAAAPSDANLKIMWTINKALTGNKLQMKMKENGEVVSISGFDAIYNKISSAASAQIKDATEKAEFMKAFKQSFNEKILKEQFGKNLIILPKEGAKIGQKWTETENATPDGSVKLTTTYTLKSIENGVVTLTVSGGIPKKTDKRNQEGLSHSLSSELAQNGTIKFDQKTGWIINQNVSVKTTQTETISDGKQTQSMKSSTNSTVIVNPKNS
ncbi:DUF6263 family protein [Bergeyella sp. RCAD1439]|uniref:DUF6263 family protein n=1 Tax=Bergeyella anatis TaxID=3113737 RepID=UPI002E172A7F|nr:DUF6263 family protein [Bergeyella sp. RCAD1439]